MSALLEITDLNVHFALADGDVHAVKNASLTIAEGQCLGVVGESGSGKSQLFLAAFGLLAGNGRTSGSVRFRGAEILGASPKRLNALRGGAVTMIFQDPLTSLTPHMKVGAQIAEALMLHQKVSRDEARRRAQEMLEYVRIPESARRLRQYPHELSGGMRQRVMIAMATITGPDLIIAVDDDINIQDPNDVEYALAMRMEASKDLFIVPGARTHEYVRKSNNGIRAKVGIDATVPFEERDRFARAPFRTFEADASSFTQDGGGLGWLGCRHGSRQAPGWSAVSLSLGGRQQAAAVHQSTTM